MITIEDDETRDESFNPVYAKFIDRSLAFLLDFFLMIMVTMLLIFLFPDSKLEESGVVVIGIGWLYFALQESSRQRATLGKKALRIQVTGIHGEQISFLRATARHFGRWISAITLLIGYLMVLWDARHQSMHDKIVKTVVIKVPRAILKQTDR
ncbi:hypothetical protein BH09BAC2_BH09BAC2_06050 [soil metagenome]